jgi:Fur family ferric uptake transcriptional regulator
MEQLVQAMQARGLRATAARRAVLESIPAERSFRAEEVWDAARRRVPDLGRATVFRTLGLLVRWGLAERVAGAGGSACYLLNASPAGHRHMLSCTGCGCSVPLADDRLEGLLVDLAIARGFTPERHTLVLYGRCPGCRPRAGGGRSTC